MLCNKQLINLVRRYPTVNTSDSVWDFPAMTSLWVNKYYLLYPSALELIINFSNSELAYKECQQGNRWRFKHVSTVKTAL